jgi:hypothetical protein
MNAGKYKDLRSTVLAAFAIFCMDDGRRLRMTRRRCIHMHACVKVQKNQPRCCLDLAMHGVFHSSVDMCNSGNETKNPRFKDHLPTWPRNLSHCNKKDFATHGWFLEWDHSRRQAGPQQVFNVRRQWRPEPIHNGIKRLFPLRIMHYCVRPCCLVIIIFDAGGCSTAAGLGTKKTRRRKKRCGMRPPIQDDSSGSHSKTGQRRAQPK